MLTKIAAGGLWPNQRLHEAGLVDSPMCDLCDDAQVQDEYHLMWTCCGVKQHKAMRELDDDALVGMAETKAGENLTFWTRGLAPCADLGAQHPPAVQ